MLDLSFITAVIMLIVWQCWKASESQMKLKSSNEMHSGSIETNYVYLFYIIISIVFILCFEYLFSWRKKGELMSSISKLSKTIILLIFPFPPISQVFI